LPGLSVQNSFSYHSTNSQGAILALPEGATSFDYLGRTHLDDYIKKHAKSWLSFVYELGYRTSVLTIITGVDRAKSWGVAAYSSSDTSAHFSVDLMVSGLGGLGASFAMEWKTAVAHDSRVSHPRHRPSTGERTQNNAVFVRGLHIHQGYLGRTRLTKVNLMQHERYERLRERTGHSRRSSRGSLSSAASPLIPGLNLTPPSSWNESGGLLTAAMERGTPTSDVSSAYSVYLPLCVLDLTLTTDLAVRPRR
jgi:hypothetical protein